MKRTYQFIVNPVAGPKNNVRYFKALKAVLNQRGIAFDSQKTKRAGHATELVKKLLGQQTGIIVSVGGDGTFNEAASALVGTDQQMAHIPRGSGNGLARMLKIPNKIDRIGDYLEWGKAKAIDVGKIGNHNFFCTCGFGFDALIAHHFDGSEKRGLKGYVHYVAKSFFRFKGVEAQFALDGKAYQGRYFTVTIANANQYGNDAFIAPSAELEDGLLNVTMIKPFPVWYAPVLAVALFGNWIDKARYVETCKVREVEIRSLSQPYFHADGDVYQLQLPAKITVQPQALNLLVPSL
ncbi:diacylglycerol kinase family protein [Mangrovibacterium marinum]|uniref:YegS/Rv2252/BmrU family lipid kinase n=1 Tax=Mangrovibacterium marinum TaxID=1639118 RepID=A0A2T5C1T6_9BACT|nr:diacylglycerol kinase family protein [Mangrovibacterium marinum]PTN08672.1 YegS/Rv2252/BmrU family lipid kinase [Mangrovibacterium marinum]